MSTDLLKLVEATQFRGEDLPAFEPGDTIAVHVRVIEGAKERIHTAAVYWGLGSKLRSKS